MSICLLIALKHVIDMYSSLLCDIYVIFSLQDKIND